MGHSGYGNVYQGVDGFAAATVQEYDRDRK